MMKNTMTGLYTKEAIMPNWMGQLHRNHGQIGFRLTQLLTGHGVFYKFLYRIGKANSPICPHCKSGVPDSVEHTLKQCQAQGEQRNRLLQKINIDLQELSLETYVKAMIESKEGWTAAYEYAEEVMKLKEEQERRFEEEAA